MLSTFLIYPTKWRSIQKILLVETQSTLAWALEYSHFFLMIMNSSPLHSYRKVLTKQMSVFYIPSNKWWWNSIPPPTIVYCSYRTSYTSNTPNNSQQTHDLILPSNINESPSLCFSMWKPVTHILVDCIM